MSIACPVAPHRRRRPMERLSILGILLGVVCLAATARAGTPPRLYAAAGGWPSPEQITAYATAIGGAVTIAANTLFLVWHKLRGEDDRPRKPRRKRKARADAPAPSPAPKPDPPPAA